jgi:hypothetical protein
METNQNKELTQILNNIKQKRETKAKRYFWFLLIPVTIGTILFVTLTYRTKAIINENIVLNEKIDSVVTILSFEDTSEKLVIEYLSLRNQRDASKLLHYYSDKIDRYFTDKNITKEWVTKDDSIYWTKNPRDTFIIESVERSVNKDTVFILVSGIYNQNLEKQEEYVEEFRKFKIGKDNKIFFVRGFLGRPRRFEKSKY